MASSGNFCNFSIPLRPRSPYSSTGAITGGGLSVKLPSSGGIEPVVASISPNSGKWYWEYRAGQGGTSTFGRPSIAVSEQGVKKDEEYYGGKSGVTGVLFVANDGGKRINGSDSSYGNTVSQHDIVQVALDCDNGAVYFGINNTWQNSGDPTSGSSKTGAALSSGIQNVNIDIIHARYVGGGIDQYNFGQDSTFGGAVSAGGNADGNGFGDFKYAPPSGYLALCSANLPISDDIDPAQTDDDYPSKQFNPILYTGNGGTNAITGLGFQPDLVWLKRRNSSASHQLYDSSRGTGKLISSNNTDAEQTVSTGVNSFDSDGFTLGSAGGANASGGTFVAWCWRANGGTTSSNSNGQTTSTVQANQAAGFSIVEYAGTLTSSGTKTIGHGLSKAPEFIIIKNPDKGTGRWFVQHEGLTSWNYYLSLNTLNAQTNASGNGSMSDPTNTVFYTNWTEGSNEYPYNHIAYCWHSVEGYSKFGSFEGNSNADGPFIYTGFRPRLVFCKAIDATENWQVRDTARSTSNANSQVRIYWNSNAAEGSASTASPIDFLSNGFKVRGSNSEINSNTIVYGAWGDVPFKYNNTF